MPHSIVFVQAFHPRHTAWREDCEQAIRSLVGQLELLHGYPPELFCFPQSVGAGEAPLLRLADALARAAVILVGVEPSLFNGSDDNDQIVLALQAALDHDVAVVVPLVLIDTVDDPEPPLLTLRRLKSLDFQTVLRGPRRERHSHIERHARVVFEAFQQYRQRQRRVEDDAPSETLARRALAKALYERVVDSNVLLDLLDEHVDSRPYLLCVPSIHSAASLGLDIAERAPGRVCRTLAGALARRFPDPTGELVGLVACWKHPRLVEAPEPCPEDPVLLLRENLEFLLRGRERHRALPAGALLGHLPPPALLGHGGDPRSGARALAHDLVARERVGEGLFLYLETFDCPGADALRRVWPLNPRRRGLAGLFVELFHDEVELRSFLRLDPTTRILSAFVSPSLGKQQAARASVELLDCHDLLGPRLFGRLLELFPERRIDILRAARPWLPDRGSDEAEPSWRDRLASLLRRHFSGPGGRFAAAVLSGWDPPARVSRVCFHTGTPLTAALQLVLALEDGDRLDERSLLNLQRELELAGEPPEFADEIRRIRQCMHVDPARGRLHDASLAALLGPCARHVREQGLVLLLATLLESELDATVTLTIPRVVTDDLPQRMAPVQWSEALVRKAEDRRLVDELLGPLWDVFPRHAAAIAEACAGRVRGGGRGSDAWSARVQALAQFLDEIYDSPQALRSEGPALFSTEAGPILRSVPCVNIPSRLHAWEVVVIAGLHGYLDRYFFDALASGFPRRATDVATLRSLFAPGAPGCSPDDPPTQPTTGARANPQASGSDEVQPTAEA